MKQKEIRFISASGNTEKSVLPVSDRILKRRKLDLFRTVTLIVIVGSGLIFFTSWYRSWPQDLDCQRMNQRLVIALENYRHSHRRLPQILKLVDVRTGRYTLDHYEYWFEGLGGPEVLPEGTIIAYCKRCHNPMFSDPWRSVILFMNGVITTGRMNEPEFQQRIAKQFTPEKYWSLPRNF